MLTPLELRLDINRQPQRKSKNLTPSRGTGRCSCCSRALASWADRNVYAARDAGMNRMVGDATS
jgi:hypothetical protein